MNPVDLDADVPLANRNSKEIPQLGADRIQTLACGIHGADFVIVRKPKNLIRESMRPRQVPKQERKKISSGPTAAEEDVDVDRPRAPSKRNHSADDVQRFYVDELKRGEYSTC